MQVSKNAADGPRVALSKELGEFLIELSIALNRTAMYPSGHPSLGDAASVVIQHLATLLYERPTLSIGVARRQLVIEGVATDARNPVLRSLAERMHEHHIGALVFERGASTEEVQSALTLLAQEPERGVTPLGLGDPSRLVVGPHVRLYALTYEQLELVGDGDRDEDEEERAPRATQLWIGLARAALAAGTREVAAHETEPAAVAQAINEHDAAQAYDQVIVGYLLQIADELKAGGGAASAAVRRRMSRLVGALNQDTLKRLVEMGGDGAQRQQFLLDASQGLSADAVVDLVKAAGDASSRPVSQSLLRILTKLSSFAGAGDTDARSNADAAVREQIRHLVSGWSLESPNPEEYEIALESMSRVTRGRRASMSESYPAEPIRVLQIGLESGGAGPGLLTAVDLLIGIGEVAAVVQALGEVDRNAATRDVWGRLATTEVVLTLLHREPVDFETLDAILEHIDRHQGAQVLLDALVQSESRTTRMGLLKLLGRLGDEVAPLAAERLSDERWFVKRNMLALLRSVAVVPKGVSPIAYARHEEPRVRREAIELAFLVPAERDRALGTALTDEDERIVRIGMRAAQDGVPETAVPLLARLAGEADLPVDLRVQIVRALRTVRSPIALDALIRMATQGSTFFGRPRIAPKSADVIAALAALGELWRSDPRVVPVLRRAARSSDPDIRAAVEPS
jgi:hypothetical protein